MIVDLLTRLPPELRGDFLRVVEVAGASLPMDALFADLGGDRTSVVSSDGVGTGFALCGSNDFCSSQRQRRVD